MCLSDYFSDYYVNLQNRKDEYALTLEEKNFISGNITLAKTFSLRGVPTSILIDKDGKEFARIIGSIDFDDKLFINWFKTYN